MNGATSWTFPNIHVTSLWSVNIWFKKTGATLGGILLQNFSGTINVNIGDWGNGGYQGAIFDGGQHLGTVFNVTNNLWTNIQITWDGTSMKTYINGSLIGSVQPGGTGSDNGGRFRIGQQFGGTYTTGEIGEVSIYKALITAPQVQSLYNNKKSIYSS